MKCTILKASKSTLFSNTSAQLLVLPLKPFNETLIFGVFLLNFMLFNKDYEVKVAEEKNLTVYDVCSKIRSNLSYLVFCQVELRSHRCYSQLNFIVRFNLQDVDKEISTNVRWENFLVSAGSRPLQPSPELKNLIRLGVPTQHRERIWNS